MEKSVIVRHVTKKYKLYRNNKEKMLDLFLPNGYGRDFYALRDISFKAEKGDVIGIIGVNGSGKSTMSNIIAGVIPPTSGNIQVNGEASLIAIASGMNNQLTGRENIELKCLMLGFSKKEIIKMVPDIIEFADIGDFIDQPVKSYSSGMKSRLGFAISVHMDPDILVIDEALSVGDQTFAEKCLDKMNEFKARGKTIFFISHSIGQMKRFCQKALWIQYGHLEAYGPMSEIMPKYEAFIKKYKKMTKEERLIFQQKVIESRTKAAQTPEKRVSKTPAPIAGSSDFGSRTYIVKKRKRKKAKRWALSLLSLIIVVPAFFFALNFEPVKAQVFKIINHYTTADAGKEQPVKQKVIHSTKTAAKKNNTYKLAVITKDNVNIRKSNDLNSPILLSDSFGSAYRVIDKEKDKSLPNVSWYKIQISKQEYGWVSSSLVKIETNKYQYKKGQFPHFFKLLNKSDGPSELNQLIEWFDQENIQTLQQRFLNEVSPIGENEELLTHKNLQIFGNKNEILELRLNNIENDTELLSELKKIQIAGNDRKSIYFISDILIAFDLNEQNRIRQIVVTKII